MLTILLMLSIASNAKAQQSSTSPNLNSTVFQLGHPQLPSQDLSEENKLLRDVVLTFLNNVGKLNVSRYNIEVYVDERPGSNYDKTLKFNLSSSESQIDVLCLIKDNSLFWCTITPIKGAPAFTTETSDALSNAKDALDELQALSPKSNMASIRSMLNSVNELKSAKTSTADFTQEIAVSGNTVRISWEPSANGLSNPQNKLTLEFKDGHLAFFADYLGMFKIGNTGIKISEQEAIQIAIEQVKAFSWVQGNETVSNVTVLSNSAITNLTMQNRGNATLYPYWDIWLPLNKMYPGGATAFHVGIWADTGEVAFISPIGYYGDLNADSSEPQTTPQAASDYGLAIAVTLIAATAIIVSYLLYKKSKTW